jgi:hypothetical protein
MKYIMGISGVILIIVALSMNKVSAWGVECYFFGQRPTFDSCLGPGVFFVILTLGTALLIAAAIATAIEFQKKPEQSDIQLYGNAGQTRTHTAGQHTAASKPTEKPFSTSDSPAWKALKEFDADIRDAARRIIPFGVQAEERLASAYMALNDKKLLESIMLKITQDEEKRLKDIDEETKKYNASLTDRQRELVLDRRQRAQFTIDRIKEAGMVYGGKQVLSAELFDGERPADQGWAKIVYEDGTAELRAGSSFTTI